MVRVWGLKLLTNSDTSDSLQPRHATKQRPPERVSTHWSRPPHGSQCRCDGCRAFWSSPSADPRPRPREKGANNTIPRTPRSPIPGPSQQPRNQQHAFFQMRSEGVDHQGLPSATGATKHQHQTWPRHLEKSGVINMCGGPFSQICFGKCLKPCFSIGVSPRKTWDYFSVRRKRPVNLRCHLRMVKILCHFCWGAKCWVSLFLMFFGYSLNFLEHQAKMSSGWSHPYLLPH